MFVTEEEYPKFVRQEIIVNAITHRDYSIRGTCLLYTSQHALAGIRVCVCVLVLDAVIKLAKKSLIDAATYLIFAAVVILSLFTDVASFVWIVCAGAAGVIIKTLMERSKAQKKV